MAYTRDFQLTINRADEVMVSPADVDKWFSIGADDLYRLLAFLRHEKIVSETWNSGDGKYAELKLSPGRVTVEYAVSLSREYLSKSGNEAGGNLHLFLSDGNMAESSIRVCLESAEQNDDSDGVFLCEILLATTERKRKRIYDGLE